jgi:hypothetical protein
VPVSGSVPRNLEHIGSFRFQKSRIHRGFPFPGTRNPSPVSISRNPKSIASFYFQESMTHGGFPFLGTQNSLQISVPGNSQSIADSPSWESETYCGFSFLRTREPILIRHKMEEKVNQNVSASVNAQKRIFRCLCVPWEWNLKEWEP